MNVIACAIAAVIEDAGLSATLRTYFRVDPVVVYLFIELSLDWRQTALRPILSHTQKRVVKDMILIFGFR